MASIGTFQAPFDSGVATGNADHTSASQVVRYAADTDCGLARPHNEDAWHVDSGHGLFLLADGMGGYNAGEVASDLAVKAVTRFVADTCHNELPHPEQAPDADLADVLQRAVDAAHAAILAAAARRPECLGMGTTIAIAWIVGRRLVHAHVGDSRIYRWRAGSLQPLTSDHSIGEMLVSAGVMGRSSAQRIPLRGILTRALGADTTVTADVGVIELACDDLVVICSDGLTDMVDEERIALLLAESRSLEDAASRLIAAALDEGGADNVTVLIAQAAPCAQAG